MCHIQPSLGFQNGPIKPRTHSSQSIQGLSIVSDTRRTAQTGKGRIHSFPTKLGAQPQEKTNAPNNKQKLKKQKPKGVYARPSAAIERGSGFYVPGLEGSRVRGLFGVLVLTLTVINTYSFSVSTGASETVSSSMSSTLTISEIISITYSILLILQGLVEFGKENGFVVDLSNNGIDPNDTTNSVDTNSNSNDDGEETQQSQENKKTVNQYASPQLLSSTSSQIINDLQWISASFVSLTPATHILLVKISQHASNSESDTDDNTSPSILYTLGSFNRNNENEEEIDKNTASAIQSVVQTAFDSKGGRVSVPSDHPGSYLIPNETYRRCLLFQRLTDEHNENQNDRDHYCLVVGSNQLLAAFTKNDLKWLGRLANYLELSLDTHSSM